MGKDTDKKSESLTQSTASKLSHPVLGVKFLSDELSRNKTE